MISVVSIQKSTVLVSNGNPGLTHLDTFLSDGYRLVSSFEDEAWLYVILHKRDRSPYFDESDFESEPDTDFDDSDIDDSDNLLFRDVIPF